MNLEQVRLYALSMPGATEDLFDEAVVSFRVEGKWFMLMHLWADEACVAVKLPPDRGIEMRDAYEAITPAWHMNKRHWNDLRVERLPRDVIEMCIRESYEAVVAGLPKAARQKYQDAKLQDVEPRG